MTNANEMLAREEPAGRLLFIDNIRWVLMILVVLVHIAMTYASRGDFFTTRSSVRRTW